MIATKTCACGQEIEFEAEMARELCCPNCGAGLVEEGQSLVIPQSGTATKEVNEAVEQKVDNHLRRIAIMGAVLMGTVAIGFIALAAIDVISPELGRWSATRAKADRAEALYPVVTNAVTVRLKAPRTAVFDGAKALRITESGGQEVVRGYVDSQNGFGALLRMEFIARVRDGTVTEVEFPGQEK